VVAYDNLSSVSQNVLKCYQMLTGEERRIPLIFDNFHFCCSRVIGLDMMENRIFPTSVQPISITKTLLIVPTKNERELPLFTGKLLVKFQNILRNTTQIIIRHRVNILFSIISSPITLEVGSGGYILVSCAHSNTSLFFSLKLLCQMNRNLVGSTY
jgi:hypothetical protein